LPTSPGLKTVPEFLKLNDLDINEVDLVKAVVRWGEFQLKKDPEQSGNLES
jgi:hypothetical protein